MLVISTPDGLARPPLCIAARQEDPILRVFRPKSGNAGGQEREASDPPPPPPPPPPPLVAPCTRARNREGRASCYQRRGIHHLVGRLRQPSHSVHQEVLSDQHVTQPPTVYPKGGGRRPGTPPTQKIGPTFVPGLRPL